MKRQIIAGLAILAVVAGVGLKLASDPETTAGLQEISLIQRSERSHISPSDTQAALRIRLSPSDFDDRIRATTHEVPKIALAAE